MRTDPSRQLPEPGTGRPAPAPTGGREDIARVRGGTEPEGPGRSPPVTLELFCCSGGMAEGFRRAGIAFDLAFDADPDACASYERNLGRRPIRLDVRDLAPILRSGGWDPGPVDLLVADPPCTPWSRAGKCLGIADERDMLEETCELIALLRPRAYLVGNIPGLDDAPHQATIQRTIGALLRFGYCTADFVRLDAASFGVPQHRIRPFWFGHLAGPCIRWPVPTHGDPREVLVPHLPGLQPLRPWVTCGEALAHLPLEELGRPIRLKPKYGNGKYWSEPDKPALNILAHESASGGHWLARDLNRTPNGLAWPWDRPATTIDTRDTMAPFGRNGRAGESQRAHPDAVILSERAAAILQGFPDPGAPGGWFFAGRTKRSRWSQLGMAMPPALAEAVARSVRAQMEAATMEGPIP